MALYLSIILSLTAALFTLSAMSHLFYIFRRDFEQLARWSTRLAWLTESVGLVLMVLQFGRAPVHTLFEFAYLFIWVLTTFYILIEFLRNDQNAGSFLVPVVAVVQIVNVALPKPSPEHMVQSLPASLVGWHIGITGLGYASFLGAFVCGALYLLQDYQLRRKRWGPAYYRMPSLETLDIWGARFVYIGFPLMTLGTIAGMTFAQLIWMHTWYLDPKILFTALVWLVYAGYLLMRQVWGWGGKRSAWWAVLGVIAMLINYFLMDILSSLHRFGA